MMNEKINAIEGWVSLIFTIIMIANKYWGIALFPLYLMILIFGWICKHW